MATIGAVVAHNPADGHMKWEYEQIPAPRQPKEGEVLVRVAAVGICHTDVFIAHIPHGAMGVAYPKILGHEGAGYVEAVGPGVTCAAVGDPVLLSYTHCGKCDLCTNDAQTYCEDFGLLNVVGESELFASGDDKGPVGKFFGQSSFAAKTLVDEKCIVNVKDSLQSFEELKRCAPLGCGLMTGTGTALKYVQPHDILLVTGLGAVGLGAIMAAKIVGAKAIIAVDRVDSRLKLASELGATHTYDTTGKDISSFTEDVRALVGGQRISYAIETTGVLPIIEQAALCLGKRGRLVQIGIPPIGAKVPLLMDDFYHQSKVYEVNYLGDAKAQELVPRMVEWYKEGKYPLDKIVRFYRVSDVQQAVKDMHGEVVKPVLIF